MTSMVTDDELTETREIYIPYLRLTPYRNTRQNFAKMFSEKTRMIGRQFAIRKCIITISVQYQNVTEGQTDGQTDREKSRIALSKSRVSTATLTRDNQLHCSDCCADAR